MDEKTDTKTATKTKITLNLKDIRDASRVINQNSMLNLDVAESFIERINAFNEEAIRYKNNVRSSIIDLRNSGSNLVPERIHRTITISGGRGSGKTTFLLSNLNKLSSEKNKTIEILDILDPTLIEQKDHLFVNIISRIKQRVQAKMTQDGNRTGEYKEWEKSLRQLAEGLPMLDGVAGKHGPIEDCWADPVFIMEKGLKEVKAANQLEQNFHK